MKPMAACALFVALWSLLVFGLLGGRQSPPVAATEATGAARTVYIGHELSDVGVIQLGAAVAAADPSAVLLLDSECLSPYTAVFLRAYRPDHVIPVGSFPEGAHELASRLETRTEAPVKWSGGRPLALWRRLFPEAAQVVVCPAEPRGPVAPGRRPCRHAPRAALRPRRKPQRRDRPA